jgi:hypothetical protein
MVERLTIRDNSMRTVLLAIAGAALAVIFSMALRTESAEALEIRNFAASPSITQAGGHPDLTITYSGETRNSPQLEDPCQCNDPKQVLTSLPTGFIGNPHATPQCKAADFARQACPADSQVGTIDAAVSDTGGLNLELKDEPIYNTVPRSNQPGLLAVSFLSGFFSLPFYVGLSARTGSDYGLDADANGLERQFVVQKFTFKLWGVPADDSHTPLRYRTSESYERGFPSNSPHIPFLTNPSSCAEQRTSSVKVVGYDGSVNTASYPWPEMTGCDQLTFNPSLSARPTTTATDSASGVDINLTVPQLLSPTFPSPSEIKGATVALPVGFSINPSAADGKLSCTDMEAAFGTTEEAVCPEFSKIGTDTIDSPALPQPVSGGMYLGQPLPGNRYRVFLTADGFGTHIKLAGTVNPDPNTGQVIVDFPNLPQSPLEEFDLHVFGAERGLLATPTQCGTYAVKSTFIPWDEVLPSQTSTQFFHLESGPEGQPCPGAIRPFNPSFTAASSGNTAGAHSPFSLDITRPDGDQSLTGITVRTPPGFSATLAGIPYCPEAAIEAARTTPYGVGEAAAPSCPAASQIGTGVAGAGSGTRPIYLNSQVYLAGPYKGAPLSLVVITPAVTGPYDLGNVVVRAAIYINPTDAHVTAISDPLPQIHEGILLRLRRILIKLDRPGFALNPTNCDPFNVTATLGGDQGASSTIDSHYQVANCANLPFAPGLAMKLTGGLKRRGHPSIHAELTMPGGEANLKTVQVTLPKGELLDNAHIGTVCTRPQFATDSCPAGSRMGKATVRSPLLDHLLVGDVYLRSSTKQLPDLAIDFEGQIDFEAVARIDSVNGSLRARFENLPDVPVSQVVVDLLGGSKGLLQNSETLCVGKKFAAIDMTGQNGAEFENKSKLQVSCSAKARKARHKRGNRR